MQSRTREAISGTQSIERAFTILREVKAATPGSATVAALAKKARLNRTTTHRIVSCLVDQGALRREPETGHIVLGPFARDLGIGAPESLSVNALFAPVLTRIAEKTGDTAFLMIRSGNDTVCVDRRWGSYPIKTLVVEIGTRRPLGIGAGSVAMLAAMTPEEYQQVLRDNARALKSY
ncbi:MAG: IclR family transcriptional regulator, partial [Burkholderiales bacterium]